MSRFSLGVIRAVFCVLIMCSSFALGLAQESSKPLKREENTAAYTVQVAEYQLDLPPSPFRSESETLSIITASGSDSKVRIVETISLSALSGKESDAHFGRRVTVAVGNRQGAGRSLQVFDVGTNLKVTVVARGGKIQLSLNFETSRIGEQVEQEIPPEVNQVRFNVTRLLIPGRPAIVGSSSYPLSSFFVVTITPN